MSGDNPLLIGGSPEIDALTAVVRALQPLSPETRQRIVESALVLLGSKPSSTGLGGETPRPRGETPTERGEVLVTDIRQLKEQKKPASANEMAALVAYYLAEVTGAAERKESIEIADVERYFKHAGFRLPQKPKMTLVNAKSAGYFDSVGEGKYKLNPVGYNLVAHSLPRAGSTERVNRRSPRSRRRNRKQQRVSKRR